VLHLKIREKRHDLQSKLDVRPPSVPFRNELLVGGNSSLQGTVLVVIGNVVEKMLAVWAQT